MTTPEEIPTLIHSDLSGEVTRDGITIEVHIYRLEEQQVWTLEVEDSAGGSTVWDDEFETDAAAMEELNRFIGEKGMKPFNLYYISRGDR